VDDRPLPFDEHQIGILRVLEHETLGRTGDEVGDHRVDGHAAPLDEDARLARRGERGADPSGTERVEDLQLRRHLADVAIGADGEHDRGIDGAHAAARHVEARGGTAQVVDRHPRDLASAASSGTSAMKVCRPLQISRPFSMARETRRIHSAGSLPPPARCR
jgi:hypothetical protein